MRWDAVVEAATGALNADSALTTELGTDADGLIPIYPANSSRPVRIPSIEFSLLFDRLGESLNPLGIQFDYFALTLTSAVLIEGRLRAVLHRDVRRSFAGTDCATLYDDSRDHPYPKPGVVHRSLDFRFEPVRADFF